MSKKSDAAPSAIVCSVCGDALGEDVVPCIDGPRTLCPKCFAAERGPGYTAVRCGRCGKVSCAIGSKSCPQCNFRVTDPVR